MLETDEALEVEEQPQQQPDSGSQLKLSINELKRLACRINDDFSNSLQDHHKRMNRFLRYYRMWRKRTADNDTGNDAANFHVPLTKWQVFTQWAKEVDALLGEDSEIIAKPTGPTDGATVRKVGRYMTWRVFDSMQITSELIVFIFHKLIFGRAFAYSPYKRETFDVPDEGEQVDFEGPGFETIWPDNILLPAEEFKSLQKASFVIRRYKVTADDLLAGEEAGLYQDIEKNWEKIHAASLNPTQRNFQTDELTVEKDRAEGVLYDNATSPRECLEVWEWYGRWRLPKGKQDAREDNFKRRRMRESELVVRYIPDIDLIISVQDRAALYPKMKNRIPIVEASLVKDGSYWGPSVPELLEDIELEMDVNHNLATEAGERSVGPLVFYKPASGVAPKKMRYEPGMMYPSDNPKEDVHVVQLTADLSFPSVREQQLTSYAEKVTGITEQNLGRQSDRPNEPRTLGQTQLFLGEGNIRLALNHRGIREDLRIILQHFWALDSMYAGPEIFFRVTEEEAGGLFAVDNGFGKMTASERNARYDFDLQFATSTQSKEQKKQESALILQTLMASLLFQQNPAATYLLLDDFLKSFGRPGMSKYMPKPGPVNLPMDPAEEWTLALQGEDFHVNEADDDQAHIEAHQQQLANEQKRKPEFRDSEAEERMVAHILEHQEQIAQKQQAQAASQAISQALTPLIGAGLLAGVGADPNAGNGDAGQGGYAYNGGLDLSGMINQGGV
ncbi:MAG: hypothetical protein WBV94_02730 [Blastocatellia bacterium]